MPELRDFLGIWARYLDTLAPDSLDVRFQPGAPSSAAGEILVGTGRWQRGDQPVDHRGVCLQHKGINAVWPGTWHSVTGLVARPPESLWDQWLRRVPLHDGRLDLTGVRLVVEDAAPDSALALTLFAARLWGVPARRLPAAWLEYVERWETGDIHAGPDPLAAWGPLHAALAHSLADAGPHDSHGQAPGPSHEQYAHAWLLVLRFVTHLLRHTDDPGNLAGVPLSPEYRRASAYLAQEKQYVDQQIQSAETVQLVLPMVGNAARSLLVDAYLSTEQAALGADKVFLRRAYDATWTGQGFGLMAVHRPALKGTGDDVVVSVDPATGTHLTALWHELERLEDAAWAADGRPRDDPRPISSYPHGDGPNQPWWDDHGTHTLVAAPRTLPDGRPGRRVEWPAVLEAIWRCYNPARSIRVLPLDVDGNAEAPTPLVDCRPRRCCPAEAPESPAPEAHAPAKGFLAVRNLNEDGDAFLLSPTLLRYFAARAALPPETDAVRLTDLPREGAYDEVHLTGGIAIIHHDGVFLFDDWENEDLPVAALWAECRNAVHRLHTACDARRNLNRLTAKASEVLADRRVTGPLSTLLEDLAATRADVQRTMTDTDTPEGRPEAARFRERLETAWGVRDELAQVYDHAQRLQESIRGRAAVRANQTITALTVYGFPLLLLAAFFQFVLAPSGTDAGRDAHTWALTDGVLIHWPGAVAFGIFAALGIAGLHTLLRQRAYLAPPAARDSGKKARRRE